MSSQKPMSRTPRQNVSKSKKSFGSILQKYDSASNPVSPSINDYSNGNQNENNVMLNGGSQMNGNQMNGKHGNKNEYYSATVSDIIDDLRKRKQDRMNGNERQNRQNRQKNLNKKTKTSMTRRVNNIRNDNRQNEELSNEVFNLRKCINDKNEMIDKLNKLVTELSEKLEKEKDLRQKALAMDNGNDSLFDNSENSNSNDNRNQVNSNHSSMTQKGHSRTNSIATTYRADTEQLRWELRSQLSKMATVENDISRLINVVGANSIVHSRLKKIQETISSHKRNVSALEQTLHIPKYEINDLGAISSMIENIPESSEEDHDSGPDSGDNDNDAIKNQRQKQKQTQTQQKHQSLDIGNNDTTESLLQLSRPPSSDEENDNKSENSDQHSDISIDILLNNEKQNKMKKKRLSKTQMIKAQKRNSIDSHIIAINGVKQGYRSDEELEDEKLSKEHRKSDKKRSSHGSSNDARQPKFLRRLSKDDRNEISMINQANVKEFNKMADEMAKLRLKVAELSQFQDLLKQNQTELENVNRRCRQLTTMLEKMTDEKYVLRLKVEELQALLHKHNIPIENDFNNTHL